jgi:tetratricopeptide (TPR) repeat protein/sugar lactone lactonase YvrE/fibronectin type 3 domain-containing protein
MRTVIAALFFSLFPLASFHAQSGAPSSTKLVKVGFVQDIGATGIKKLLGGSNNRLFVAKQNGSVDVVTLGKDGKQTSVALQAKGRKGEPTLKQPEAAVAANGVIYVVDSEMNRVAMFADDGKYKGSFGRKGDDPDQLRSPRGITYRDGILYVADTGNGRIQLFGDNGVFLNTLEVENNPANKTFKDKKVPYNADKPTDISVDPAGQIYVLDAGGSLFSDNPTIKVYSPAGVYLRQFPQDGKPVDISMAEDGLYVADQVGFAIQKYDLNGKLVNNFGSKGDGRAQFKSLSGLVAERGQIFIGDSERGAIHNFMTDVPPSSARGPQLTATTFVRWQETIPATVGKMAWDGKDTLYAVANDGSAIIRLRNGAAEGALKLKDITPAAVAVDKDGALWVLDKSKMRVIKLDSTGNTVLNFGSWGSQRGQFRNAAALAISSTGIVFVADAGNRRVQAFSNDGVLLNVITSGPKSSLSRPSAIALDPQDNLYVLDTDRETVTSYSATLEPIVEFGQGNPLAAYNLKNPVDVVATHTEVMVLDSDRVKVYSHDGKYIRSFGAPGKDMGEFDEAIAIAMKDASTVVISEQGNKRVQAFTTIYKPAAPEQVAAQGTAHAVELKWAASPLPYVSQYRIYRSGSDKGPFISLGASKTNQYSDQGLPPDQKYFYMVASESNAGYEGLASPAVNSLTLKYIPPALSNVQVTPAAVQLKMHWDPLDSRFVSAYLIYQKNGDTYTKVGETATPEFIKDNLTPGTDYTFYLATRSVDGIESEKQPVQAATTVDTSTPVEINVVELHDVFSNTYKLYEQAGIGTIKLTNNTNSVKKNIKVTFVLNNFMDYPTETKIDSLLPGESKDVTLMAVFNNTILTLTEDTPVQAKLEASYFENGQPKAFSKIRTINVYDKHRLIWSEPGRYAAFITPKDPVILNFTRSVATEFGVVKEPTQLAAAVFDTLGALGVTYVQDPTNPYQISSRKVDTVDYIEYPREAISRKSGDCDDLVALYSASLEALGISTRALLVPEHMLMMFNTGIVADPDNYTMDNMYVIYEGTLWIPVETTLVGKSFAKAWEKGAEAYYKWKDKGLVVFDPHDAWLKFKPATLPDETWRPVEKTRADVDKAFPGDSVSVLKISSQTKTRRYMKAIQKNPADMDAHLQIGIIMAKAGDSEEAMKYFDKIIEAQPKNASALNNKGNLYMLDGQYQSAQELYLAASQADPQDAEVLVNLAKVYMATKNATEAKEAFARAQKLDASIAERYKALALELQSTLSPSKKRRANKVKEPS